MVMLIWYFLKIWIEGSFVDTFERLFSMVVILFLRFALMSLNHCADFFVYLIIHFKMITGYWNLKIIALGSF